MPEQFVNPEVTKPGNKLDSKPSAEKRIEKVADDAAAKAGKTVKKKFDRDEEVLFNE